MAPFEPLTRRAFCRTAALAGTGLIHAGGVAAAAVPPDRQGAFGRKRLVLFTLYGGNDGLNTIIPWRDPLYARLRPELALPVRELLPLSQELALHPALKSLHRLYDAGEVAIVQDVGYPQPSLSHFESIEVWDSGQPRRAMRQSLGWYGGLVRTNRATYDALDLDAAAVSFDPNIGFAAGNGVPVLRAEGNAFQSSVAPVRVAAPAGTGSTAQQLAEIVNNGIDAQARFAERLRGVAPPKWEPYEDPLTVNIKLAEWFLRHGIRVPLLAMAQSGYDTHSGQLDRQAVLLAAFDAAIGRLRETLVALGTWHDTVILVHSEFGRRVAANSSGGTDHGTSGPVLLIGGKVGGGIFGTRAPLDALDGDGNLVFTTDFRQLYVTVAAQLWNVVPPPAASTFVPLPLALA